MPEIPEGAKQPQDHKAAKAEATDPTAPVEFKWRGQEYVISPDFRDDVEILEELEDGNELRALRRILGQEQWDAFKDANRGENGRVSVTVTTKFLRKLFKELGQGNSVASPAS